LSSWYEGYIYSALLGIRVGNRKEFSKKMDKAPKWSHNYVEQFKFCISLLLTKEDILNELGLLDYESIIEGGDAEDIMAQLKSICDEYSNGGLEYLSDLYEKDNSLFDDYDSLKTIMEDAIKKELDS